MDIRFYYLQQAIRKGKVVDSITSFVGRERVWKKRYINRGESIMIFEIVRGIEMDVPIPTNYSGIRRREKGREVFFRKGVFWGNIDINKMNRGMFGGDEEGLSIRGGRGEGGGGKVGVSREEGISHTNSESSSVSGVVLKKPGI